jgi:pyrroline-5-carboxylate reductase
VAEESEFVFLVVKPGLAAGVVKEIADAVSGDCTLVSMVTGVPIARLRDALGRSDGAVIRVMPNTPALVGAGAFALAAPGVAAERVEALKRLLDPLGRVVVVGEELMDAVTGVSGSGPAFVFVMIEAMADGGVAAGLPRAIAQQLAAQTVMGAAKMVLETGDHPAALKDAVASPGGTTIAGLSELEKGGFRAAVVSAVRAAARRARELSES